MDNTPDHKPDTEIPSFDQPELSSTKKASIAKKALLGVGSLAVLCVMAGATFLFFSASSPKASVDTKVETKSRVETVNSIDQSIDTDIDSEQKDEDDLSDTQSQAIVDEVNATEAMEGSYVSF